MDREDLERALRRLNVVVESMRDDLLTLGAQVADLTEELARRGAVDEGELEARLPETAEQVRMADEDSPLRVALAPPEIDKYAVEPPPIPCAELLSLCKARCCSFHFALSTQDLDEGVVRWDYTRPYYILQKPDGYCAHIDEGVGCTIYERRPAPCRAFDCREDDRIWLDYEARIPAPASRTAEAPEPMQPDVALADLARRARERQRAMAIEELAVRQIYGEHDRDGDE